MASRKIKKVLVANRGEIAVRVMRACREMNISSVAVFSEADRLGLHVRMADEAYGIGAAPSRESYLCGDKIIAAARKCGADAVHPGYGFLAENPEFAEQVVAAGLCFIGPTAAAMRLMGDKTAARERMVAAGVPVVPGIQKALSDEKEALAVAREIGVPVMLKAAAGGGGKGMRIVRDEKELAAAFRAATSEADSAFGDGRVYIEKYIEAPRHIEFQIIADHHSNVIHLGERECSIQRRHQKVIEEAPSCILNEDLRQRMGEAAVKAASACGYRNAGTIEFMLDQKQNFFFLEMNTRLQVEHPVTEMVTGLDLVKWQIRIAQGQVLPLKQEDVHFRGHAVECRIYAEDPHNNFLPSTGVLSSLVPPAGPGVRDDSGYYAGAEVSIYYDPLIAKLITWGRDRSEAIARMRRALSEYIVQGVETSIPFCHAVMKHKKFLAGDFDTHFIKKEYMQQGVFQLAPRGERRDDLKVAVMAAAAFHTRFVRQNGPVPTGKSRAQLSAWKRSGRLKSTRS